MVLIKRSEGTNIRADRGILSNYITMLNSRIAYIRTWHNNIKARTIDVAKALKSNLYLKMCIVNY
jgi:hypothetical protein